MIPIAIGLDLIDLDRFSRLYALDDEDVLARCFTANELSAASNGTDAATKLAARFAAKEAVLKVLGGLEDGIALTDIEVRSHLDRPPTVSLSGGAATKAARLGITAWLLSLTHTDTSAAAVAIGLGTGGA